MAPGDGVAHLPQGLLDSLAVQRQCGPLSPEADAYLQTAFARNFDHACSNKHASGSPKAVNNDLAARGVSAIVIFLISMVGGEPRNAACALYWQCMYRSLLTCPRPRRPHTVVMPLVAGRRGFDLDSHMMLLLKAFSSGVMLSLAQASTRNTISWHASAPAGMAGAVRLLRPGMFRVFLIGCVRLGLALNS